MKKRMLFLSLVAGALMLAPVTVFAETITSNDGVVSIETPDDSWALTADPNYWFVISDGKSIITLDHLSNGESLPSVEVANEHYKAISQSFVSTLNEVFVVKGMAAEQADLEKLMRAMGSIKILKYDTKTALAPAPEVKESEFGLREINENYYITASELMVRTDYSIDASIIGTLYRGEQVRVLGEVTKGGQDYGWCKIQYQGSTAYVSDQYVSRTAPSTSEAGSNNQSPSTSSQSTNTPPANSGNGENELVRCEFCGEYFSPGNDYRNHVMAAHPNAYADDDDDDMIQCDYCGQWFSVGNDFRNHVLAAHPEVSQGDGENEMIQCDYCGEYFSAGDDFRNHILTAHPEVSQGDGENEG
jgi:uncharacterized C2H2 Zn-finger protein